MPITKEGYWTPAMIGKQFEQFNSTARCLLVSGPSLSGKSYGNMEKITRHMWDTDGASVAFFTKIIKTSFESGSWDLIHKTVIPEWVKSGIGFSYTTKTSNGNPGPRVSGTSRTPTFGIRNRNGHESVCRLFSLEYVDEIEDKIKDQSFSLMYFAELDKFDDRRALSVALPRLRMPHLRFDQHQWLADTNPAKDGDQSWIFEVFYLERVMTYSDYLVYCQQRNRQPLVEDAFLQFQKQLQLIEMFPEDNPFLDPKQLDELKSAYAYDPDLYARYVLGKWVFGFGDQSRHLRSFFKPTHIVGVADAVNEDEWELALPSANMTDLITGWDVGDVTNHAQVDIEPIWQAGKMHYIILDECVSIGDAISTADFTGMALEKIEALEQCAAKLKGLPEFKFNLERAYSDNSILRYSAHADDYPYLIVNSVSGGRIFLQAMEQADKAVRQRVQLLKHLLAENRIHVSANCKATIKMFKELRKGKANSDFVVNNEDKHIFDAITFALIKECSEELMGLRSVDVNVGRRDSFEVGV